MKTRRILLIFICFSVLVMAKDAMKRADTLFKKGEYYLALEEYQSYSPKKNEEAQARIKIARCLYNLNRMDEAYKTYYDVRDSLEDMDIYMYASALNKIGNYKEAIKWYYNVPKRIADSLEVKEKITSCRWAMKTKESQSIELKPTRLADLKQSFGIQYYKNGVVFSYPEDSKNPHKIDNHGLSFQNLYYADLKDNQIAEGQKKFSSNLVFPYHVGAITFSHNYTKMYYTKTVRLKRNKSVLKIFSSTFNPTTNEWDNEVELPFNNDDYNCAHPAVTPDSKFLYFTSDKPGGIGGKDIYRVEIKDDNQYSAPVNIGKPVNTIGDEMFPFISKDYKLYFSSNGHDGYGGLDVFKADYADGKWTNIQNMTQPVNSSFDDFAYIINPNDSTTGFVSSDRGNTTDIIYSINKIKRAPLKLSSIVENATEGYPIENCDVTLYDATTDTELGHSRTDKYGAFEIPIPDKYRDNNQSLAIKIKADEYDEKEIKIPAERVQDLNSKRIPIESQTQKFPKTFSSTIVDTYDSRYIKGKQVTFRDAKSSVLIGQSISDSLGMFSIEIPDKYRKSDQEFNIDLAKGQGYAGQNFNVSIGELEYLNNKGIEMQPEKKALPTSFSSTLTERTSKTPIANAKIKLRDTKTGQLVSETTTKKDGTFTMPIPDKFRKDNSVFKVEVSEIPGYLSEELSISINNLDEFASEGIKLSKETDNATLLVNSSIKDNKTGVPVANAQVRIRDTKTHELLAETTTKGDGTFSANIPQKYKNENREISIETHTDAGYADKTISMKPNQTETLKNGIAVQAKDNNTVGIISKLTTTYTGEPIANATVKVSDAQTGKKLAETKTKEDGSFEIFISDEYRGPKEFIIEISKGNEYAPKKIVSTIEDLDNLRKEGIPMTPIFSDDVLNEINSMVVPHDRKVISKRGYAVLDRLAYFMKQNPAIVIKLTGHTDIRGERADNLSLSQELAETAKQYLASKGISPNNIIARGYGDRYVINKCRRGVECSITEHMANNRIEIIVWKKGK